MPQEANAPGCGCAVATAAFLADANVVMQFLRELGSYEASIKLVHKSGGSVAESEVVDAVDTFIREAAVAGPANELSWDLLKAGAACGVPEPRQEVLAARAREISKRFEKEIPMLPNMKSADMDRVLGAVLYNPLQDLVRDFTDELVACEREGRTGAR